MIGKKLGNGIYLGVIGIMMAGALLMPVKASAKSSKLVITDKKSEDTKTIYLAKGKNKKLYVLPASKKKITWSSSNSKVAKIKSNGRVYGKKTGKAKITARIGKSKKKASISIRVYKEVEPKKITIAAEKKQCYEGESIALKTTIKPANATKKTVKWTTSNGKVATVDDNGVVHAAEEGSCKITAQIVDSKVKAKIKITVKKKKVLVSGLTTSGNITLEHGKKASLSYQVHPLDATNKDVGFYSSNNTIVTVDQKGQIEALRPGTAVITIKAKDASKVSTSITVTVTGNTGFLTKQDLDAVDLTSIDNLMIVAHPDDEAIFGGGHIAEDDYFIVCLTNGYNRTRKNEFMKVLSAANDKGMILSYPDTIDKGVRSDWKNVKSGLLKDLQLLLTYKKWDQVVTHNPQGEYGHQHHKMTNQYVTDTYTKSVDATKKGLVYFGRYYAASQVETVLKDAPKLSEKTLAKKLVMHKLYVSQAVMTKRLSHMNPYEEWVNAEDWE